MPQVAVKYPNTRSEGWVWSRFQMVQESSARCRGMTHTALLLLLIGMVSKNLRPNSNPIQFIIALKNCSKTHETRYKILKPLCKIFPQSVLTPDHPSLQGAATCKRRSAHWCLCWRQQDLDLSGVMISFFQLWWVSVHQNDT